MWIVTNTVNFFEMIFSERWVQSAPSFCNLFSVKIIDTIERSETFFTYVLWWWRVQIYSYLRDLVINDTCQIPLYKRHRQSRLLPTLKKESRPLCPLSSYPYLSSSGLIWTFTPLNQHIHRHLSFSPSLMQNINVWKVNFEVGGGNGLTTRRKWIRIFGAIIVLWNHFWWGDRKTVPSEIFALGTMWNQRNSNKKWGILFIIMFYLNHLLFQLNETFYWSLSIFRNRTSNIDWFM